MRQFIDFTLSIYVATDDKTCLSKIKEVIKNLDYCLLVDTPLDANFSIVDATLYLESPSYYDKHFDACLKLLSLQDYEQIDLFISHEKPFYLRKAFVPAELSYQIELIREHLNYKFQSQILSTLYNAAQNSIVITDTTGQIEFANTYFLNATGYSSDEVLGHLPKLIKSNVHDTSFYQNLWSTIQNGETWSGFFINRQKNGRFFYEEATISPIVNSLDNITNYIKIGKLVNRERLLSDHLSQEIKTAKDIIAYMLPPDYKDDNLHFEAMAKAYNYLGGDFICFERVSENKYIMALLDVMGHGASATLIGLKAISVFQSTIYYDSLTNAVAKMNDCVCQINQEDPSSVRYLSGIFLEVDLSQKKVNYISAGHPSFYIKKKEELTAIPSNNMIVGIKNNTTYTVNSFSSNELDYIFLYSDGLIEHIDVAIDDAKIQLENSLMSGENTTKAFTHHVLNTMLGDNPIDDDITLCRLKFYS
jgi:PAS domain S-box-containing protein